MRRIRWVALGGTAVLLTWVPTAVISHAGAATATWNYPSPIGQVTAWAYMIGYSNPVAVPSFISSPTGSNPNTAVDVDEGNQDGLTSTCPSTDGFVTGIECPAVDSGAAGSASAIHTAHSNAICYVDVGTAENWRSDYSLFDPSDIGGPLSGWPGEYFINVNDWSTPVPSGYETIAQIMTNRFALCKEEGFQAIEADNVDAYTDGNLGGFTISQTQEEGYVAELTSLAHQDGLYYFLKNEINGDSFITDEVSKVDGEIDEQCWQYGECSALEPFIQAGKPIMNVEYDTTPEATLCGEANKFPMATNEENVAVTSITFSCSTSGTLTTETTGSGSSTGSSGSTGGTGSTTGSTGGSGGTGSTTGSTGRSGGGSGGTGSTTGSTGGSGSGGSGGTGSTTGSTGGSGGSGSGGSGHHRHNGGGGGSGGGGSGGGGSGGGSGGGRGRGGSFSISADANSADANVASVTTTTADPALAPATTSAPDSTTAPAPTSPPSSTDAPASSSSGGSTGADPSTGGSGDSGSSGGGGGSGSGSSDGGGSGSGGFSGGFGSGGSGFGHGGGNGF
jgi:hypothetical protein